MDKNALLDVLVSRDAEIKSLKASVKFTHTRAWNAEVGKSRIQRRAASAPARPAESPNDSFEIQWRGQKQTRFTARGMFSLAIRRNLSNIGAKDLGAAVLEDVTHQTICRAEETLSATLIGSMKQWNADMLASLPEICCYTLRSDATNSGIWHQSKLFGAEITSTYIRDSSGMRSNNDFHASCRARKLFADCQRVLWGIKLQPCLTSFGQQGTAAPLVEHN